MAKRGRPKNEPDLREFHRNFAALDHYWKLRKSGDKHAVAVAAAGRKYGISATALRRFMAMTQPKGYPSVWTVKTASKEVVSLGWGQRPTVLRSNSPLRDKTGKRKSK